MFFRLFLILTTSMAFQLPEQQVTQSNSTAKKQEEELMQVKFIYFQDFFEVRDYSI